jgi:ATP-dependent exoDNAse (exonuclease V) beta subunit
MLCQRAPGRPAGRRFGTLVHQLLRGALDGSAGLAAAARSHGRVVGASADEVQAAVHAVEEALRHPLMERARHASVCHCELPIAFRLEDGRMIEGNIDLAFEENGEWIVLDFKTDADLGDGKPYESQVRWYAYALARLTGRPARCILLGV